MNHLIDRITVHGRTVFGVAIAAVGTAHLICANMRSEPFPTQFHATVIPVIPWIPAHPWLAYVTGIALLAAGIGIAANLRPVWSALITGGVFFGSALILHIPRMIVVPGDWALRGEVCELLALSSTAFVLAATAGPTNRRTEQWSDALAIFGRTVFGTAVLVFGVDHFLALDLIASLVPAWLPWDAIFATLTGAVMIAAGVAIVTRWFAGPAALGLGTMFLTFVLTLHLPRVLAAPASPDEWSSALIALGMCGASWIQARTANRRPRESGARGE